MELDANARRDIAERELLLPCRVELRQIGRIGEEECRSSEFGKEHVEITLACYERLVLLGVTSAQRDADEVAHPLVEVCEERIGFGLDPIVADSLQQSAGDCDILRFRTSFREIIASDAITEFVIARFARKLNSFAELMLLHPDIERT